MSETNLSFEETQAYKLASRLAAIMTDITRTSFPEHKWAVFGGVERYEVRLVGAKDIAGKGHTEDSELPQANYSALIAALNGANAPTIQNLKIFSESTRDTHYVRPVIGHIKPRYEDGVEQVWSLNPYAADIAFLQDSRHQIKMLLEHHMGVSAPKVRGDFASAAVDGCQKVARSVAGGMKKLGEYVQALRH